ncbi:anaphase-promoting complex subunit 2 isoform X2 [Nematostella vectensis]|nr:anaphase-promoting complex subunit 2 isoform X2 [Nematostella vectensis]XP_048587197.1 anaphase-promoting complex subunit 2 isoform X2 [Nematostella vectensis]
MCDISPCFWRNFDVSSQDTCSSEVLVSAVKELHDRLLLYQPSLDLLHSLSISLNLIVRDLKQQFQSLIRVVLFTNAPENFNSLVEDYYCQAFRAYSTVHSQKNKDSSMNDGSDDEDEVSLVCPGCAKESEDCGCKQILVQFTQLNSWLNSIGLLQKVAGAAHVAVIHKMIKERIEQKCKGEFESSFLQPLENWMDTELYHWLFAILGDGCAGSQHVEEWKPRLKYFMYKTYADLRIGELFSIIVEFPDSTPAIQDLKECLEMTNQRGQLVNSLREAFETRLLHPGANTSLILSQYVSAIRSLHVLDPTGVILENVCEPVRQYLRTREDTVRCIVSSLTDENTTELAEELMHGEPHPIDGTGTSDSEDDEEDWVPDPVDAPPARSSRSGKAPDIISMLVNIYGSKDLFVSEYRTLLADRILSTFNYDTDRELRYLELLKLRFGESHLHFCEIMLKDVADSRRINSNIHSCRGRAGKKPLPVDINAMILSAVFWPLFREEKLKVPDAVETSMAEYRGGFEALKAMRTLEWKTHLGLVEVELELEDRTLSLSVSPVHATAIWHFQEKERWQLDELSSVMHVTPGTLRRRLAFWVSQGVLREESPDTYIVMERQKGIHKAHSAEVMVEAEPESATASVQQKREEELQVFWSYIVGMLTNLESLPLERIHSMLRIFAMQGPESAQCSVGDLKRFLDCKVKEQELQFANGFYRLPKTGR